MYFKYEEKNQIKVDKPFKRVMVPFMMGDTAECPVDFSVHITEWGPGSQVDEHIHEDAMEAMYCIQGHGLGYVNGIEYPLDPDCMIVAAPGESHCIKNIGDEMLRCVCIFSPPNTAEGLRSRAQAAVDAANEENK